MNVLMCKFRHSLSLTGSRGTDKMRDMRRKYSDIGGMDVQKQEIREAVELPLTQFDLYRQIGIDPPRGVLLYGPPGKRYSLPTQRSESLY